MSKPPYQLENRELLAGLLTEGAGFHGPAVVLEGLTPEQAYAKPLGLPHSIAEIVAHMCYWQDWFNNCAERGFTGIPEHAEIGWPRVGADGWDAARDAYFKSIEESQRIVATSQSLGERLLPEGVELPVLEKDSNGSGILHAIVHNGHHLGQIITIRQLLGAWPPPAGPLTW